MDKFDVVVAGHICLDIIPQMPPRDVHNILIPGSVVEIGPAVFSTGGAVSNTGRSLHRLGIRTRLMGKVGNDQFGKITLDLLREDDSRLVEDMIVATEEVSSYTLVISLPQTDRIFLHCPGANHTFKANEMPYDRIRQARLFHFGYPPFMQHMYSADGAALVEMYRCIKEMGVITSLDMALPDPDGPGGQVNWRRILGRVLPYIDLFLPSLDELLFMLQHEHAESDVQISQIAAEVQQMGARIVVLKLGSRGLYMRTGPEGLPFSDDPSWKNRELWTACFEPKPLVGTTGAGDATIAGFLAAILRGQTAEAALTSAVAVGACNVEAPDALSGIRSWEDTQVRIQAGWKHSPLTISAPGWMYESRSEIWCGPSDQR